jgi:uncharacterized membrane protein
MSDTGGQGMPDPVPARHRSRAMARLRAYFLTGLLIAAPLFLTVVITWWFIQWIDSLVTPFIPPQYRPDQFSSYYIPGFGLVVAIVFITMLGFLTRNYVGGRLVSFGESIVGRMPVVRGLYRGIKQIFETVLSGQAKAFQTVGLIEYPRKGLWSIVFIAADTRGEIQHHLNDTIAVYLPTTPNPTSGFLLFVPRSDVIILDMSLEDAAKLVISGGLVTPDTNGQANNQRRRGRVETLNPPSAA